MGEVVNCVCVECSPSCAHEILTHHSTDVALVKARHPLLFFLKEFLRCVEGTRIPLGLWSVAVCVEAGGPSQREGEEKR
jgi:hypothetical protein